MDRTPEDLPPADAPSEGDAALGAGGPRSLEQVRRAHRLESLGRMAGGIAHDFNNVLGVILGYVELAKMNMKDVDPRALRHLDLALSTLDRARTLADHLLDFAREERRPPDTGDLNEAVQAVRELLTETIDRQIDFDVTLGRDVPPCPLEGDEVHQAVSNLCFNAAQALPTGGKISLETSGMRVEVGDPSGLAPGRYACLRVRDTGPGIPVDLRERIFDPYFTTRPHERSGLGLWVVRVLVERYGGRVKAGGDEGGAVLTIWMPSEVDVRAAASPTQAPACEIPADPISPARDVLVDVLIVDDEPGVRDVTRGFLELDGYRVWSVGTGAEAQSFLQRHVGGVLAVFLDHRLADVHGTDLAWEIHRAEGAPAIVMTTGLAGAPETSDLPEGTRVLAKPFLHADVTRLLQDDLGIRPRA